MDVERIQLKPHRMVGVHEIVMLTELPLFFGRALTVVSGELRRQGVAPAGPPVAFYQGISSDKADVTVGFPVDQAVVPAHGVVVVTLPGGPAIGTVHIGPYDGLPATYAQLGQWMAGQGLAPGLVMWEQYLVGRDVEPAPARWQTLIVYPIATE
jgi:effector-binding domain-containing protein